MLVVAAATRGASVVVSRRACAGNDDDRRRTTAKTNLGESTTRHDVRLVQGGPHRSTTYAATFLRGPREELCTQHSLNITRSLRGVTQAPKADRRSPCHITADPTG